MASAMQLFSMVHLAEAPAKRHDHPAPIHRMTKLLAGQSLVVPGALMQQKADLAENYLKAEIEALAFSLGPKNKPRF